MTNNSKSIFRFLYFRILLPQRNRCFDGRSCWYVWVKYHLSCLCLMSWIGLCTQELFLIGFDSLANPVFSPSGRFLRSQQSSCQFSNESFPFETIRVSLVRYPFHFNTVVLVSYQNISDLVQLVTVSLVMKVISTVSSPFCLEYIFLNCPLFTFP